MRIDCKDKELWGNVLVTIEWLVTFIFLIFDRGEKILVDAIPVIVICGYLTVIGFPFFVIQKKTMFCDVSINRMLDFYFWGVFVISIADLVFFCVSYFVFQTNLCLYFASQGIFFWFSIFRKKYDKKSIDIE